MDQSIRLRRPEDGPAIDAETAEACVPAKREKKTAVVMRAGRLVRLPKSEALPPALHTEANDGQH